MGIAAALSYRSLNDPQAQEMATLLREMAWLTPLFSFAVLTISQNLSLNVNVYLTPCNARR